MNILLLGRKHIAKSEDIIFALKNIGIAVDFLLLPNFHYAESDDGYSVSVSDGDVQNIPTPTIRSRIFYYVFHSFRILFLLGKYFRKNKYDILFAVDWFEGAILLAYRFLFARKARVVFYGYDYYFFSSRFSSRFIINRIDAWVTRHVDEAWVVNDAICVERENQGVYARLTKTVPLGISGRNLSWDIRNNRHFLFVGNCKEGHNLLKLIDVFAGLAKVDSQFELTIVGKGNLFESLDERIRKLRVESNIHLRGFLSEKTLSQEIQAGLFAAGVALYEETPEVAAVDPGKVKEYLSWNLPVVTTPFNQIAQDIRDSHIGFVVKDDKLETIAKFFQEVSIEDLQCKKKDIPRYVEAHSFEEILRRNLLKL